MINPYQPPSTDPEATLSPASRRRLHGLAIVALGLLIPGLPTLLMRQSWADVYRFLILLMTVPAALLFFGPFWDLVLFRGTKYGETGFYPFIVVLMTVPVVSVWIGFRDRARVPETAFK